MTTQEIINEYRKLSQLQQREILETISGDWRGDESFISEAETAERLLVRGIIGEIPENWNEPDDDFETIEIKGKPLSETIIEDRR